MANWLTIGKEYTDTYEKRAKILEAVKEVEWFNMPAKGEALSLPMMPGEGIKAAIREFRIPKVSRVGHGRALAPYGLIAIEGNYSNGQAQIYLMDSGIELIPLFTDFSPTVEINWR